VGGDKVAALDGATFPARPESAAAVDAEDLREPRAPADACISPKFAPAAAGGEDVEALDVMRPSPATPCRVSSTIATTDRQPSATAETCKSPESANGVSSEDAGDGDARQPEGSDGTLATIHGRTLAKAMPLPDEVPWRNSDKYRVTNCPTS
jgi:hypothetical protein